jgi:hypothetical protein
VFSGLFPILSAGDVHLSPYRPALIIRGVAQAFHNNIDILPSPTHIMRGDIREPREGFGFIA